MANRSAAQTIDEYIAEFPPDVQARLEEVRALIHETAPDATESISYAIPTFDLNGHLVHFAAFKHHIGFYPTPQGLTAFEAELAPYKQGKGSAQFPLDEPLPTDLIRRIVEYRVAHNASKTTRKPRRKKTVSEPTSDAAVMSRGGAASATGAKRVVIESFVHPGQTKEVDAEMYGAMRAAMLQVLPASAPGLTRDETLSALPPVLPETLFPGGKNATWWSKAVQLDLEAKGIIVREPTSPLRWHRTDVRG